MSEEICYYNYQYQGQVYSPAFSDPPPSPMSTASDQSSSSSLSRDSPSNCEDTSSSIGGSRLGAIEEMLDDERTHEESRSDESPRVNEHRAETRPNIPRKPKFPTRYHEMLQPMSPMTTLSSESTVRPLPRRTHVSDFDQELQDRFQSLLIGDRQAGAPNGCELLRRTSNDSTIAKMEEFLLMHSEKIDINQYSADGQTPLQLCCLRGDLPMAKLLVRFGANSKLTTREGFSTLHIAAFGGNTEILGFVMSLKNYR